MRKRVLIILIILGIVQLFCFFCYWYLRNEAVLQIECGDGRLAFYYTRSDKLYADGENIQINGYQSSENREYYLFFPDPFRNKRCRVLLYGAEVLTVNGGSYRTDSYADFLEEGRYSLAANDSFYVLNIMYGSRIPSVFISLDTENLALLQESKENTDTGRLNMYNAGGAIQYRIGGGYFFG